MSLFRSVELPCPSCNVAVAFDLSDSINADRRPDLRDEVLARTFQEEACPSCGTKFRVDPEFSYVETGAGLWIAVYPSSRLADWSSLETESRETFDRTFGVAGFDDLSPRLVFGWEAFHEKLVIQGAGLNDASVEIAKIILIRESEDDIRDPSEFELRMLGTDGQDMEFGWFQIAGELLIERTIVQRALIDEIDAAEETWQELRADLTAGSFVDIARMMLAAK